MVTLKAQFKTDIRSIRMEIFIKNLDNLIIGSIRYRVLSKSTIPFQAAGSCAIHGYFSQVIHLIGAPGWVFGFSGFLVEE
jgi:hypothetical protein